MRKEARQPDLLTVVPETDVSGIAPLSKSDPEASKEVKAELAGEKEKDRADLVVFVRKQFKSITVKSSQSRRLEGAVKTPIKLEDPNAGICLSWNVRRLLPDGWKVRPSLPASWSLKNCQENK